MALVVEDGTGLADANSYADLDFIRAWAAARGVVLSATDADVEVQATLAMDYMEGGCYFGVRSYPTVQALAFPRNGMLDGFEVVDYLPGNLAKAQAQLVLDQARGVVLQPSTNGEAAIQKEKVGPIETTYFAPDGMGVDIPVATGLLAALQCGINGFALRTIRV